MIFENKLIACVLLALLAALAISFLMTPVVKTFAYKVGAIDVPKDNRRMHKVPVPRLGGLAIFIGFMVSILLFAEINREMKSILLGAVIIVVLGVVDDIMALPAMLKFVVQIAAALIPALNGVQILAFSNPNIFSKSLYWVLGGLSIPFTVLWIVAITNAVNLIDGLDGLASSVTLIVAVFFTVVSMGTKAGIEPITCAVVGGLMGFLLFNVYPAKVFMGDTGSLALGGFVAGVAYVLQMPLFILLVGLIYLVEVLSVIIQVTYFKATHGKRIFKMAPIHHHFELCGWSETRVVAVFSIVTAIMCLIAFLAL